MTNKLIGRLWITTNKYSFYFLVETCMYSLKKYNKKNNFSNSWSFIECISVIKMYITLLCQRWTPCCFVAPVGIVNKCTQFSNNL